MPSWSSDPESRQSGSPPLSLPPSRLGVSPGRLTSLNQQTENYKYWPWFWNEPAQPGKPPNWQVLTTDPELLGGYSIPRLFKMNRHQWTHALKWSLQQERQMGRKQYNKEGTTWSQWEQAGARDSQENLSCCSKRTLSRGQRWEAWQALIQVSTLTWRTDGREGGLEAGGRVGGHHRDLGTWWHHSTPQHMVEKKGWFHISGCGNSLGEGCSRRKNFWAGVTLRSGRLQHLWVCAAKSRKTGMTQLLGGKCVNWMGFCGSSSYMTRQLCTREGLGLTIINQWGDFSGGPVAKIPCSQCRGLSLTLGQATRSHILQLRPGTRK